PVVLVERFEDHGLVAGVDEGEHGRHPCLRGAAGDDQVRLRIGVDPVEALRPTSDRVPQFLRAPGDGVLVVARVEGALRRIGELARRVEVRVALGQVDRVVERGDAGHLPDHRLREFLDAVGEPGILDRQVGAASASGWGDAAPLRRGQEAALEGLVPHPDGSSIIYQELEIGVLPLELICEAGQVKKVIMTQGEPSLGVDLKNVGPLAAALGVRVRDIGLRGLAPQVTATGIPSLQVPMRSLEVVRKLDPALRALKGVVSKFGEKIVCYAFALEATEAAAAVHALGLAPDLGLQNPATGSAAGAWRA